ncbi:MAG: hypothetical protein A2Y15_02320 [Clostridiales bacterium GWF2_36_10]|nr:MAG: hypothetical protein A2Y15_02320 [Clostridiales bacterium GWF2_36_10]HAN21269.1 hypothetical protein [Clostridiales bacterium]
MKKFILKLLCLGTVIIFSFIIVITIIYFVPPQYTDGYNASILDKYERLTSINEPKIILVGGSNFAFGIDSKLITDELNMPVVNLGLHAGLGSEFILELSKKGINSGDIIIVGLEYALYKDSIDSSLAWTTIENNTYLYSCITKEHIYEMIYNAPEYALNKAIKFIFNNDLNSGMYVRSAFNEYGDNIYNRTENIMEDEYLNTSMVTISNNILMDDIIEYLNNYYDYAVELGAEVYITFPCVNSLSIAEGTNIIGFYNKLKNEVNIPIISNIEDYILNPNLFYDTNYHLNNDGVRIRTNKLIEDIRKVQY